MTGTYSCIPEAAFEIFDLKDASVLCEDPESPLLFGSLEAFSPALGGLLLLALFAFPLLKLVIISSVSMVNAVSV